MPSDYVAGGWNYVAGRWNYVAGGWNCVAGGRNWLTFASLEANTLLVMHRLKLFFLLLASIFAIASCFSSKPQHYSIASSKDYAASMFRQHCAICHGPEGEGRTLPDGKVVPNMREGQLKFRTEAEIYKQLTEGGNGMTPFRDQLTKRELDLMTKFIHDELRR